MKQGLWVDRSPCLRRHHEEVAPRSTPWPTLSGPSRTGTLCSLSTPVLSHRTWFPQGRGHLYRRTSRKVSSLWGSGSHVVKCKSRITHDRSIENWEESILSGMAELVLSADAATWCTMARGTLCKMTEVEWFLLGIFIVTETWTIVIVR